MSRETSDRALETEVLNFLGETLRAMAEWAAALDHHESARALTERTGDQSEQARALEGMAAARQGLGEDAEAQRLWYEALSIYLRLGLPEAEAVRANLSRGSR